MTDLKSRYATYYAPHVKKFCDDLSHWPTSDFKKMPSPFLPLFGDRYEAAPLRIVFVGIDTVTWGDLPTFLKEASVNPEQKLNDEIDAFRGVPFLEWNAHIRTRYKFLGFVLFFLAKVYGIGDWTILKRDKTNDIVRNFAWGNSNAMELYESSCQGSEVPHETWKRVKAASEPFDRLSHLLNVLNPNAVIIMNRQLKTKDYFRGLELQMKKVETRDRVDHYQVEPQGVHVFHVPHPRGMLRDGAGEQFATVLASMLKDSRLNADFPGFIALNNDARETKNYLLKHAPQPNDKDKYECVHWISQQLHIRRSVMSIPCLTDILNELGYRTNYGTKFDGVRGSYRMVAGAYNRALNNYGQGDASTLAGSFVRPNGEYAYSVD